MQIDIIGGSLSGLATAISVKETNPDLEVIVHEKYPKIGFNHEGRRCGEAHSVEDLWGRFIPKGDSICNVITKGEIYCGKKKYEYGRVPNTAFMLNRPEFIAQLGREAEEIGVEIRTHDKVESVFDLDADFIVDASGCPSCVKRELGIDLGIVGMTYQQTLVDSNCFEENVIKLYFMGEFGYYWVFPRRPELKEVNVGMGFYGQYRNYCMKEMLNDFMRDHDIEGKVDYVTGGLIPSGLQRPLMKNNILFVGDSGVGSFPLTGQGIYRALLSGEVAGKLLAKNQAKRYPAKMYELFLKWHLIGIAFNRFNDVLRHVSPNLVFKTTDFFLGLGASTH